MKQLLNQRKPHMQDHDFNWDEFFALIRAGMVIPVIGSDVICMKSGSESEGGTSDLLLYDHLKEQLAQLKREDGSDLTLMEFVGQMPGSKNHIKALYKQIGIEKIELTPLQQLARITDFDFYISTSFDDYCYRVLKEERCEADEDVTVINYSLTNYASQVASGKSRVTLLNLLGDINQREDYAITDEEVLEYLFSIRDGFEHLPAVAEALSGKSLLLIGCGFPNWLLRFFIRFISNQRFSPQGIDKYIADNKTYNDKKLSKFLRQYNSTIIPPDGHFKNTQEFIAEMYKNWLEASDMTVKERYDGTVFLSYSHDDRELLLVALKALKNRGVDVWYDQERLESGANYSERINDKIRECKVFVPFISQNSLDPARYVNKNEWGLALHRYEYNRKEPFVKPFIIDDTDFTDTKIPEWLREMTIGKFEVDNFVATVIGNLDKI